VNYITITDHAQLGEYCRELATSSSIAIDTEFVSEQTYQSELCLIQVNADGRLRPGDRRYAALLGNACRRRP
jgi:ribonuclease D